MRNTHTSKTIHLETHSVLVKLIRLMSVPLLNAVPARWLRFLMKRTSHDAATVVAHGGSTTALEAMYTRHHRSRFSRGLFQGIADFFWHHAISQPKALRNRLHIVEILLKEEIVARVSTQPTVLRILNVAGGSSRAMVQVLATLEKEGAYTERILITTLDRDDRALNLGKQIAREYGVASNFNWVKGNVRELSQLVGDENYQVIEMVGLLDYFSDEVAASLFLLLKKHIREGGSLIVANVMPNEEMPFIHKTGWPKMYYRTPDELSRIIVQAGFTVRDTIVEPLNIHVVMRASIT